MDNSVYYKVPTVIWYEIFEYLDYSMIHRKRCFFITKKGTVCKNKRIYGDCGEEIWCLTHGHKFLNKINKKDINVIKIIKEMIGEADRSAHSEGLIDFEDFYYDSLRALNFQHPKTKEDALQEWWSDGCLDKIKRKNAFF